MLDINKIRSQKQEVEKALLKRMEQGSFDLDEIIRLDDQRKELIQKADELKAERNKFSKTKPTLEIIEEMKKVGERIKELETLEKSERQSLSKDQKYYFYDYYDEEYKQTLSSPVVFYLNPYTKVWKIE